MALGVVRIRSIVSSKEDESSLTSVESVHDLDVLPLRHCNNFPTVTRSSAQAEARGSAICITVTQRVISSLPVLTLISHR